MQVPLIWLIIITVLLILESVGFFLFIRFLFRKIKNNAASIRFNSYRINMNTSKIEDYKKL